MLGSESCEQVTNEKVGEGKPRRNVSSDEQSINQEYIPPFKVISLEVPLIRTCIVKVQEGWEFRNI